MPADADESVLAELAGLPTVAHPTVGPDGDDVAVYYDGSGRNELHLLDTASGESTRLSDGDVPRDARWWLKWDADGDRVFFHLDDAGNEQNDVYAIDREGNVEPVVEMGGRVLLQAVGDDGETLLFGANRDGQMNVYRHDLPSGETAKLTDHERAVWTAVLSPDCERFAYITNEADDYDNRDVYVADVDGSNARNLEIGETGAEANPEGWGPDGRRLLVADNTPGRFRSGIYDLDADAVEWYSDGAFTEVPETFLPDGERFLATRVRDAVTVPVVYDAVTGENRELDLPDGVAEFPDSGNVVVDDDRVLVQHTAPTRRTELLVYDLAADDYEVLMEAEHGPFDPEADFADAEYFTFESDGVPETPAEAVDHDPSDELEIGALLYDSGERPSPLVVNPHGGPRYRNTKSFDSLTQTLLQRGYSVLQVNYRGSAGRGREFVRALHGDCGGAEQGDIATGVEHVLDEYDWLDGDRVAVFGHSYGGYAACWQMVQYPELYDAGVAWNGLYDLSATYRNTLPELRTEFLERYLGTPEESPELYERRSPSTHVENLSSPLLVLQGVNDPRSPVEVAREFRDRLDAAGYEEGEDGDFEYEEFGEEGHASSDQEQKLRMFQLLDDFLQRRMPAAAEAPADD